MLGANGDFASLNLYAYCGNNPVIRADYSGEFWHIVAGAAIGAAIGAVSSIVAQAVSGQEINWVEVGISAASGAITGAINTAIPGMGIAATGLTQGIVGAATYAATEKFAYDRNPSLSGTIAAGVTSGGLAAGTKAVQVALSKGLKIIKVGLLGNDRYPGAQYSYNKGQGTVVKSIELHPDHNNHGIHIQINKWNPFTGTRSSTVDRTTIISHNMVEWFKEVFR